MAPTADLPGWLAGLVSDVGGSEAFDGHAEGNVLVALPGASVQRAARWRVPVCAAGVRYRAPARKGPSSAAHWRSMIVLASAIWVERGLAQDVPVAGKDFHLTDLDAPVADEAAAVLVQLGAPASVGGVDARCHAAAGMSAVLV